ncbi:MAG TPA: hypothetical protein VFH73_05705 [Polyangia bacterium]|jgi:hypothetical protein|nr:hypothetical protein [Polyangia bacterium]
MAQEKSLGKSAATNSIMTSGPKPTNQKKPRSPNFPYLTVERALGIAEKVYSAEKRFAVPLATVCSNAGFDGTKSGSAMRAVSALKKYGIFEEKDGAFHMTPAAKAYIMTPNDPELRLRTAQEMAKRYEEVVQALDHFPEGLPDDEALKRYFVLEREFTDGGASEFTGIIKELVSFAKLYDGEHNGAKPSPENSEGQLGTKLSPAAPPRGGSTNVFSVGGATVELRSSIPLDEMTQLQLERLIKFIEVHAEIAKEDGRGH